MVTRRQAVLGLLGVTFLWGGTFVWMKQALNAAEPEIVQYSRPGVVGVLVSARFMIAFVLLTFLSTRARNGLSSKENWI